MFWKQFLTMFLTRLKYQKNTSLITLRFTKNKYDRQQPSSTTELQSTDLVKKSFTLGFCVSAQQKQTVTCITRIRSYITLTQQIGKKHKNN